MFHFLIILTKFVANIFFKFNLSKDIIEVVQLLRIRNKQLPGEEIYRYNTILHCVIVQNRNTVEILFSQHVHSILLRSAVTCF